MTTALFKPPRIVAPPSADGEPVWELATRFPPQGRWTAAEYLALERSGRRMIELVHGRLEFLPMPYPDHNWIALFLYRTIFGHLEAHRLPGQVLAAPTPMSIGDTHYREPDVFYLLPARAVGGREYPRGADWVIEVVSPDDKSRDRDHIEKRAVYAAAGIGEYWIVDPQEAVVIALTLDGTEYREVGRYVAGEVVSSLTVLGYTVQVNAVWAAAEPR